MITVRHTVTHPDHASATATYDVSPDSPIGIILGWAREVTMTTYRGTVETYERLIAP